MRSGGHLREGLAIARLLMVFSSLSPLFVLWAIRGNALIQDVIFIMGCSALAVFPTAFLIIRVRTARNEDDAHNVSVGSAEDHRGHVLVYLFATLLPLYGEEMANWRDVAAMLAALIFIVFLFWRLNLHYINIYFAIFNYQVFSVTPPADSNRYTSRSTVILITRRRHLDAGDSCVAYRLSDTVYLERR